MSNNDKDCTNKECSAGVSTTGLLTVVALAGLAYLGYKKRNDVDWKALGDKACDFGHQIKEKTKNTVQPLVKKAATNTQQLAEQGKEKVDNVKDSFDDAFNKLDARLSQLSGEKRNEYEREIRDLKNRFKKFLDQ